MYDEMYMNFFLYKCKLKTPTKKRLQILTIKKKHCKKKIKIKPTQKNEKMKKKLQGPCEV